MEDKKGITLRQFCYGAGILLVSFMAVFVGKNWNSNEGMSLNIFLLAMDPLPSIEPLMGHQSMKDQVAYLDGFTQKMEQGIPDFLVRSMFGEDIWASSFGSNKTQVAEVFVPSRDEDRNIPVLCTRPQHVELGAKLPLVIYLPGGGLVLGSPKTEIILTRYVAQAASAVVCSIAYRKAPEHPYPATINDSLDAALFLIKSKDNPRMEDLGVATDPSKVATFGLSAGAYLAAQTARLLTLEGVSIKIQISLAPMAKPHGGARSLLLYGKHDWTRAWNTYAWSVYLPGDDGELANDWTVSLLVDPPGDHIIEQLPPAYIQVNTRDVLHDEGKMYAQRLAAQHKLVELVEYDTMHVGMVPPFSKGGPAEGAFERAVNVLKTHLYQDTDATTSGTTSSMQLPLNDSDANADSCTPKMG